MFLAFFESFKYVGYTYPISILRIIVGYTVFDKAVERFQGDFLTQPRLAAAINQSIGLSGAPQWYVDLLEGFVVPNWQVFAHLITYCEFIIGASFIVGFLVRPSAVLGMFLSLNYLYAVIVPSAELHSLHFWVFLIMLWMGAGRCLGFDYFFYKRQRGLWW